MNYEAMPNRPIMCIDMKCFYASIVAMLHGLDVLKTPVAVVANFDQPGSVVLAASPLMKKRNIKSKLAVDVMRYQNILTLVYLSLK
ncbi:UV damage repair protein UvrX OS=Lysinibacillus sphaericus OX=1421 GN=LS41612_13005 PE=3 SV=1 [Lysinibacillus sphaericus]